MTTQQQTTDPVVAAIESLTKKVDSVWTLIFLGLVAPLWLGGIVWVVLANSNL